MTPPAATIHAAAPLPVRRNAKLRADRVFIVLKLIVIVAMFATLGAMSGNLVLWRYLLLWLLVVAGELWALLPNPQDRPQWNHTLREYEEAGATGVLVPAGPRLLDMLRNAGEDEDRSDLSLAQG